MRTNVCILGVTWMVLLACASGGEGSSNDSLSPDTSATPATGSPSAIPVTPASVGSGVPGPTAAAPAGGGAPGAGPNTPAPGSAPNGTTAPAPGATTAPTPGVSQSLPGTGGTPQASGGGTGVAGAQPGSATAGASNTGNGGSPLAGAGGAPSGAAGAPSGAGGAMVASSSFDVNVELASDVDPNAPGTVGIVTWSTTLGTPGSAGVEFGLDTSYGTTAPVDLAEADYRTLLLGMKPEHDYHFRVVADVDGTRYASDDYTLTTGPPTTLVELGSFDVVDDAARERGFIVASYWQGNSGRIPFIIDADGDIVWWYQSGINGIARARMSADGKNMWMTPASNNGGPIERVTLDGLDGESYPNAIGSHDLTPVSGDVMAFLEYGEPDCNSIFEIDPSGQTREIFETEGVIMSSGGGGLGCHANALRYSEDEDLFTLSDVSTDVLVISRDGVLQWRLTDRVAGGNQTWGGVQHGHQLLANSMLIYANRYGGANASGAIEYTFDGEMIMEYVSGDFSANLGDVQRLPGGNTLVTFSNDSIIHEIDPDGNLVLAIDGGGDAMGYALWRETLYGPPPDISQ